MRQGCRGGGKRRCAEGRGKEASKGGDMVEGPPGIDDGWSAAVAGPVVDVDSVELRPSQMLTPHRQLSRAENGRSSPASLQDSPGGLSWASSPASPVAHRTPRKQGRSLWRRAGRLSPGTAVREWAAAPRPPYPAQRPARRQRARRGRVHIGFRV